jgi:hypothetical protein
MWTRRPFQFFTNPDAKVPKSRQHASLVEVRTCASLRWRSAFFFVVQALLPADIRQQLEEFEMTQSTISALLHAEQAVQQVVRTRGLASAEYTRALQEYQALIRRALQPQPVQRLAS